MIAEYYCVDCGKQLTEDERPCSNCGSERIKIYQEIHDKLGLSDNFLRTKLKKPEISGTAHEMTKKKKISGKTKRSAEDTIIIDRTHPKKTIKTHTVTEFDGEKDIIVYNKTEEFKARHRKKQIL